MGPDTVRFSARAPLRAALAALVVVCAPVASAGAQDAEEEEARRLFLEGAEHYAAERFEEAAAAFARSHAVRPVPVVLFNLAQALRFASRPGAALRSFERYLETEDDPGARRRRSVEAAIAELRAEVGSLRLAIDAPGPVTVELDGHPVTDVDFREPFSVGPGNHRVSVRLGDGEPVTRDVRVARGRTSVLPIRLSRPARLVVTVGVEHARVRIDGEDMGAAPVDVALDAGAHTLEVSAPAHASLRREVTLEAGGVERLQLDLDPSERLRDRWWLWAIVGGAAVVALGVTLAAGLPQRDRQPLEGTLPTVSALRWSGP